MRNLICLSALVCAGCVPVLPLDSDTQDQVCLENTWGVGTPPEDLVGEGFYEGQILPDGKMLDQHGNQVCMWQFYGNVIAVDISTMWCKPCQELAESTEETAEDYHDQGFAYLTLLPQNIEGDPPSQDDLNFWGDTFGISAPILADPESAYTASAIENGQYPVLLVVDREMRVAQRLSVPSDPELRSAIDEVFASVPN